MKPYQTIATLMLGLAPLIVLAGKAHEHGIGRLDVAVETNRITIAFESPLDNLLGYERAPRTDAERRQADALVARLRAADTLFRIDPAARCRSTGVELASSALKLGKAEPGQAGHADIDGTYTFECADAGRAAHVDIGLFEYKRLRRLDVQLAGPKGQFKRRLDPANARLSLRP